MKIALSVAGSDSGAGAGIQADLKTFSALGVYGCTAITALTSQNTVEVSSIFEIPPKVVRSQIESILVDMPPDAAKVGMLYSREIISEVADALEGATFPLIVDPIISSGTGAALLRRDATDDFVKRIIPKAFAITPNRIEAEYLSGIEISVMEDMLTAAKAIKSLGARNVIIKGGHLKNDEAIDLLLTENNQSIVFSNPRLDVQESHGSGCNFSAALTALVATELPVDRACGAANSYVHEALRNVTRVGRGLPVTNPVATLYGDAMKYNVIKELRAAVRNVVRIRGFADLIPETQSNFAYALPFAKNVEDVAAVRGRIVKAGADAVAVSDVDFAESRHVAAAVIEYMKHNPRFRSAINIKHDGRIAKACAAFCSVANYDRRLEPPEIKATEGSSVPWGIRSALSSNPRADVIYHMGDIGKEAMTVVFGENPTDVVGKVSKIAGMY